ncbi:MAG TPA: flippase [Terriglobales bacterium]|nr:flippase [Terriglobales bacterium]
MLHIIRKDVSFKFVGELFSRVAFLLFFVIVGRKLGAAEFGSLNLAITTAMIVGIIFLDPGLNMAAVQRVISKPESANDDAGAVLAFKLFAGIPLVLLALILCGRLMGTRLPNMYIMLLAGVYTGLYAALEYICYVTNAYHRIELEAAFKVFNRLLVVALGVVGLLLRSVEFVLVGMCLATFISFVVAWYAVRRSCLRVPLKWNTNAIKILLKAGLPMAGTIIISATYLKWDLVLLTAFRFDREQIGWYASAFKCVEALSALPSMLGAALFPTLVQLRLEDPVKFSRLLRLSTKLVMTVAIPISLFVSAFSRPLVTLIYGPQFLPGALVLSLLIWCIVPMFLYFFLIWVNVAAGHASHNMYAAIGALIMGLVVNILLLPRIGFMGAAWAALLSNIAFAIVCTIKTSQLFRQARVPQLLLQFCASGIVTGAALLYLPFSSIARVAVAIGVYALSLVLFRILEVDDWSLMTRTLGLRSMGGQQVATVPASAGREPIELEMQ